MAPCDASPGREGSGIPTASKLRKPILQTLRALGGRATNADLDAGVAERIGLSAEELSVPHDAAMGKRTEFSYRMAWARTRLKKDGLIHNPAAKTWAITGEGDIT